MNALVTQDHVSIAAFVNEPYMDFSQPANAVAMHAALNTLGSQLGKEYDLWIAGELRKSEEKLKSVNPSHPSQVVGAGVDHQRGEARPILSSSSPFHPYTCAPGGR